MTSTCSGSSRFAPGFSSGSRRGFRSPTFSQGNSGDEIRTRAPFTVQGSASSAMYRFWVPFASAGHPDQIMTAGGQKITVRYSDVVQLSFTGRDMADGRSWEAWVKKYAERKAAGEKNIELVPEMID